MAASNHTPAGRSGPDFAARIEAAAGEVANRRDALLGWYQAGGPAAATENPAAPWDPGRVLAHIAEMLRYWLGETERILCGEAGPVTVGRYEPESIRILTVERDRDLPIDELLGRVASEAQRAATRLLSLSDEALAKPAIHLFYADRGEMTAAEIIEASLVGHIEAHLRQLDEALAATGSTDA
jgi:hypothetical protein